MPTLTKPWAYADASQSPTFHVGSFEGHRNSRTVKEVNFFGQRAEFVVSGSDDGNIFFWSTETGEIVQILKGDEVSICLFIVDDDDGEDC